MKKSIKKQKKLSKPKVKSSIPVALEKLVVESVNRYKNVLGFNHYKIDIYFQQKPKKVSLEQHVGGEAAADTTVDMRYLRAVINIYPYIINGYIEKKITNQEIEEIIAHEVAHLATNHLFKIAMATYKEEGESHDSWESLTTIVGRLIFEVDKRKLGWKKVT